MASDVQSEAPGTDPPPEEGDRPGILRLVGSDRAALRREDRRRWHLLPRSSVEGPAVPLGVAIQLARADVGSSESSTSERALAPGGFSLPHPRVPPGWALALAAALVAVGGAGLFGSEAPGSVTFAGALQGFGDLGVAVLALTLTAGVLRWIEAGVLASFVDASGPLLALRAPLPRVEPVAWRLDERVLPAVGAAAVALGAVCLGAGWQGGWPAVGSGVAAGALLYLTLALYPLRPGPGARILGRAAGTPDLPVQLRWSLLLRFLPVPTDIRVEGTRAMAGAAAGLAAWAALTGAVLHLLARPAPTGITAAGLIWRAGAAVALVGYVVWLLWTLGQLLRNASLLGGAVSIHPLAPSPALRQTWAEENPLTRHVPELRDARWSWGVAPEGTRIVRRDADDRRFFWIGRGRAHVLDRSPSGDPLHVATLGGNVGVGERALLNGEPRSADVVAAEDCVLAILDHDEYRSVADGSGVERRFRELVAASQSMARSESLSALSHELTSRWLARGRPHRAREGEVVIREGADERWIGLLVEGRLSVERAGERIATVGPDEVIGEMAYVEGAVRSATVRAETDVLVWRWEGDWLDGEIAASLFETLARSRRNHASG